MGYAGVHCGPTLGYKTHFFISQAGPAGPPAPHLPDGLDQLLLVQESHLGAGGIGGYRRVSEGETASPAAGLVSCWAGLALGTPPAGHASCWAGLALQSGACRPRVSFHDEIIR